MAAPGLVIPPAREDVPFQLTRKTALTSTIVELELVPVGAALPLPHLAGQYVLLDDPEFRFPPRSYSIANVMRSDGSLRLLVTKVEHGETSGWIHDRLLVADEVLVSGPYGRFVDDPTWTGPILHLAGGSGLAPVLALVESELRRPGSQPIEVLFSARLPADVYLSDELRRWEIEYPRFRFRRTLTRSTRQPPPLGRIPSVLPQLYPDLSGYLIYAAGSPGLVDACERAARAQGALPSRVWTEAFFAEPRPWHASAAPAIDRRVEDRHG